MKKNLKLFFGSILVLGLFVGVMGVALAQECDDITCNKDDVNGYTKCNAEQQACYNKAIAAAQSKANTLSNQITVFNGQISVLQLQIDQTLSQIGQLETEIDELSDRIEGLSLSLDRLTDILLKRITEGYKRSRVNPSLLVISNQPLGGAISEYKYLQKAEQQTAQAMAKAEEQRLNYDQQKTLKEVKQDELEQKRALLEVQNGELQDKKSEQEALLSQTKNDERRYQQLLAEAQKELEQIAAAADVVIRQGEGVEVNKGEAVGTMGNSGFSTGDHLHFGVYKYTYEQFANTSGWYYSNHINPLDKLGGKGVTWSTGCGYDPSGGQTSGNGSWDWPMSNLRITQNYGSNTCYNWMYGGKTHPALDMVGIGDISVRAVADGTAYFCRNCLGDGGNGVFIFHDDGYMSLYWHLK